MSIDGQPNTIDFSVDTSNLYREEAITDLKVASIRRLIPVLADGSDDPSRKPLFFGHTQLMTPQGPIPIQSELEVESLEEAIKIFPEVMQTEMDKVIENVRRLQEQQRQDNDSRIIVPNR